MGEHEHDLEPAALRVIFDQEIRPSLDAMQDTSGSGTGSGTGSGAGSGAGSGVGRPPVVVLVGAQPGAGKSRLIDQLRRQYPDLTEVIGDDLRRYHPAYRELMDRDPLRMPDATAAAAGAWVEMSIDYLRTERRGVLLETTMRQSDVVAGTLAAFRADGYLTDVRLLAVPLEVSRLSTVARYVDQVRQYGAGRWTPSQAHDTAAVQMPHTVSRLLGDGLVDRVAVVDRAGQVIHQRDLTLMLSPQPVESDMVRIALETGRRLDTLSRDQAVQWLHQHAAVATAVAASAAPVGGSQLADVERTFRQLQVDAARVIDIAHRGDPAARTSALLRLQLATRMPLPGRGVVVGELPAIELGARRRDPSPRRESPRDPPPRTDRDVPGRGPGDSGRPDGEGRGR